MLPKNQQVVSRERFSGLFDEQAVIADSRLANSIAHQRKVPYKLT